MSLQTAYTTGFRSLDGNTWQIRIDVDGHQGAPVEISLEGDEPCVIEWQETGKTDVVQGATCTLRVSNESDRQMLQLMSRPEAAVFVSLNGKEYWRGMLDDAVYEEPYSYTRAYVTELTFSDFGPLNRRPFTLKGKQNIRQIVNHCLEGTGLDYLAQELLTPLAEPKTGTPITLGMLYINADRFAPDSDSWGDKTTCREVLEEVLRPLGLRIMQKNGCIRIYDPEWLRDHGNLHLPIVWKGDDAFLRGAERYGRFEVEFDTDAQETLAEIGIDSDNEAFTECDDLFGMTYDGDDDPETGRLVKGFFVEAYRNPLSYNIPINTPAGYVPTPAVSFPYSAVTIDNLARWFRTRSYIADFDAVGIAWRIRCHRVRGHTSWGGELFGDFNRLNNDITWRLDRVHRVFDLTTGYLPLAPDASLYRLRVSLDALLSFRPNPADTDMPDGWVNLQDWYNGPGHENVWRSAHNFALLLPAKLELFGENGEVLFHYVNATAEDGYAPTPYPVVVSNVTPKSFGTGGWEQGPAQYGEMVLAYYKDWDPDNNDRDPLVTSGWTTNRPALSYRQRWSCANRNVYARAILPSSGEHVPLPPAAGRLRLTVGGGVFAHPLPENINLVPCYQNFAWLMYRNPAIDLVRNDRRHEDLNTDPAYERREGSPDTDILSETTSAGTWHKGVAPSARGLFFNANGNVWEKFRKGVLERTLEELRINYLVEQTSAVQPVLDGTAELDPRFGARTEALTPGVFLVTALRQDLHLGTEHVTMARMANAGGLDYGFSWGDPLCILVEDPYDFSWSGAVCAKVPGPFRFEWSDPVCAMNYEYMLEWDEMPPEKPEDT